MTLKSRPLAVILLIVMFGGIAGSSALGWWQTESTKEPATFTEGEFAGQADPVDIRGSYTFGDIEKSFGIPAEILAQAFQIVSGDPASFAVKDLESLYADSSYEIGTNSVRLFVAFYRGLPFDPSGQEIYLPRPASELLLLQAALTPERTAYVQAQTVESTPISVTDTASSQSEEIAPEAEVSAEEEYIVKGKTVFGDLIGWGVPQDAIEQIIGEAMPDPAMKVKDYAMTKDLDFESLRIQLQAEVDNVKD